jgi:hypothetical protein
MISLDLPEACTEKRQGKETDLVLAERLVLAEIPQTLDLLRHPEPIPVHQLVHPGVERFRCHVVEPIPIAVVVGRNIEQTLRGISRYGVGIEPGVCLT